MLLELYIKDFAIIQDLRLEFGKGLNLITGETGAGKSIIIDALQTLLGGKGFQENIREGAKESVIEGTFSIPPNFHLRDKYIDLNYIQKEDQEIIVRRIISSSGKNRSYLNGSMVTLSTLSDLSEALLEIHGQNNQISLFKKSVQLSLLDSYAGLDRMREEYEKLFGEWTKLSHFLQELENGEKEKKARRSLLLFQMEELESANLDPDEEANLILEREILSKSEFLKTKSEEAYDLLIEREENAVLTELQVISRLLSDLSSIDPKIYPMVQLLTSAQIQLKEIGTLLRDYREKVEYQPECLEKIEKRLFNLSQLKKKFALPIAGLCDYLNQIKKDVEELNHLESDKDTLLFELAEVEKNLDRIADELSTKRKEATNELERNILKELKGLKIEQAEFKISFIPSPGTAKFSKYGKESVSFFISMNPGFPPVEIEKVASGGELSRLMLVLKTILSQSESVPVLIFDEIDSGVGGAVAEFIGKRLWNLSLTKQVFCITHLPQIASFGQSHFNVTKTIIKGRTEVKVKLLDQDERVQEIGRMLGGATITPKTLKYAEEMIANTPH